MVSIKSNNKKIRCPHCNQFSNRIHDYLKLSRMTIYTAGVNTYLIADKRRFKCLKCNKSFTEDLGLTNKNENSKEELIKCRESNVVEMIEEPYTIENWLDSIVNSFIDERYLNGFTEANNNTIDKIVDRAYGYKKI